MLPDLATTPVWHLLLALGFGYLLGSIPFGLLLTRWAGLGDIRQVGSGNIGATNVLRTGNKGIALATLIFDAGKGALAAFLAGGAWLAWFGAPFYFGGPPMMAAAALGAFAGHIFPVWLGFKGGKGVATFFGTVLLLQWPAGLAAAVIWIVTVILTRISSAGALAAVTFTPLVFFVFGQRLYGGLAIIFALMVFWTHRENIARLRQGTEPRIGKKSA